MNGTFARRMFSRGGLIACCLTFFALLANHARAAGLTSVSGAARIAKTSGAPWIIRADRLMYNEKEDLYKAEGHVRITSKDRSIAADLATVNNKTRQADLRGNVTIQYGRNWVKGKHIIWNLNTETGTLNSGILYFAENNFFVQGKSISKLSATKYELKDGFISSCNPAEPDWKIQFKEMKVTVGGTAWTKDASFWARNLPIAYFPLLGVPVETQRQSGFLLPFAGDSTLNGFQFEIPYYWAFRKDMDATFYAQYLENRGFMGGVEYRMDNTQFGKGIWMFNYLEDQASPSLLADQGYPFQTKDRYWARGKQDFELPWGIAGKMDLDYVSDRNFLQEFSSGSSSYAHTNAEFKRYFDRSLLYDQTSLVRESDFYLEKPGESDLLSMDTRYWENLGASVKAQTTQELPSFSYTAIPRWIDGTPFYYTVDSSAVNYWRSQGDTEQRLDAYPRVYCPLHWGNYLDVEPSAGFRANAYSIQWRKGDFANYTERAIPDVDVEASTRLNKEFPVDFWDFTAMQHSIRPEISYEYADQTSSDPNPHLDRLDEDQSRNGVRYGFSTFLTGKEVTPSVSGAPVTTYREIARFRVFQFFNVQPPSVPDPLFDTNNLMKKGFSPVGFRMDIMPKKYLTLSYDLDWDFKTSGVSAEDLYATFNSGAGHFLRLDYEQIPALQVNEIAISANLKTYKQIYLSTYHDYSLERGLMFTQGYGIRYIRGCWGIGAGYERVGSDNRFVFTIDLLGIGSVGSQATFFGRPQFGESLPGYQHPETWLLSR